MDDSASHIVFRPDVSPTKMKEVVHAEGRDSSSSGKTKNDDFQSRNTFPVKQMKTVKFDGDEFADD
jgi:hypothetical protein